MKKTNYLQIPVIAGAILLGAVVLAVLISPAPAAAKWNLQGENPGFLAAKGRVTYQRYCANCHGKKGMGDGTIAELLKVPPSDLTTIAERNEGVFPHEKIQQYIDGRVEIRAHGQRDMPIWGDVFQHPLSKDHNVGDEGEEDRSKRMIRELVLHLETIQAPATTTTAPADGF